MGSRYTIVSGRVMWRTACVVGPHCCGRGGHWCRRVIASTWMRGTAERDLPDCRGCQLFQAEAGPATDPPGPGFEFEPQSRPARQTASLSPIAWRRVLGCMGYAHNTAYLRTSQLERTSGQSKVCGVVAPWSLGPCQCVAACRHLLCTANAAAQFSSSNARVNAQTGVGFYWPKNNCAASVFVRRSMRMHDALQFHGRGFMNSNVIYHHPSPG